MFIIRDIFYLKFGHYRDAKELLDEALESKLMPELPGRRVLTDFTGDAYRLILEQSVNTLAEFEQLLSGVVNAEEWQKWYKKFKSHVRSSHREILKQVI
jgi:hypothetical protein